MARRPEELPYRGPFDDPAGVHDHHLVADLGNHTEIMGDEKDRHVELDLQAAQQIENLCLNGHVESGGRLVGDQQRGMADQGHGDHDALAQAAGELVGVLVDAALGRADADLAKDLDRRLAGAPATLAAMQA